MTRRGASILEQADPYLAAVRSAARALPAEHARDVELARYQLYRALDRYTDPEAAEAWLDALDAAVQAALEDTPPPEALRRALEGLRDVVRGGK